MSNNNIEQLIADKLQSLNFEFKPEYWEKMHKKLDAECAETNSCNAGSLSGFLSASLLVTLFSIIAIILYFPWSSNNYINLNDNTINTEIAQKQTTVLISDNIVKEESTNLVVKSSAIDVKTSKTETQKTSHQNISSKTTIKKKVSIRKRKKYRKKASAHKKEVRTNNLNIASTENELKTQQNKANTSDLTLETTDSNTVVSTELNDSLVNLETVKSTNEINQEMETNQFPDSYGTDTVIINDAVLLDGQNKEKEKKSQVTVQKKRPPVKHVKTRSKPVKRVFKRRKGILYRLGLRK